MDKQQVRETINQMLEAHHDRHQLQRRLEQFTQANDPPRRPPNEFENLQAFIDFYEERQRYQEELQSLQTELDSASKTYRETQHTMRGILPENVPLYYDYIGDREALEGMRYMIMNRAVNNRGGLVISAMGSPSRPSP